MQILAAIISDPERPQYLKRTIDAFPYRRDGILIRDGWLPNEFMAPVGWPSTQVTLPKCGYFDAWVQAARYLLTQADWEGGEYLMIANDDVVFAENARWFLDELQFSDPWLTPFCSLGYRISEPGLYERWENLGGCCMIFRRDFLAECLESEVFAAWALQRAPDIAVSKVAEALNVPLWVLAPGICQHVGEQSCFGNRPLTEARTGWMIPDARDWSL